MSGHPRGPVGQFCISVAHLGEREQRLELLCLTSNASNLSKGRLTQFF